MEDWTCIALIIAAVVFGFILGTIMTLPPD